MDHCFWTDFLGCVEHCSASVTADSYFPYPTLYASGINRPSLGLPSFPQYDAQYDGWEFHPITSHNLLASIKKMVCITEVPESAGCGWEIPGVQGDVLLDYPIELPKPPDLSAHPPLPQDNPYQKIGQPAGINTVKTIGYDIPLVVEATSGIINYSLRPTMDTSQLLSSIGAPGFGGAMYFSVEWTDQDSNQSGLAVGYGVINSCF